MLNLVQVPFWCVWQLPNLVFGEYFGPFWPGTHTELASGAIQLCVFGDCRTQRSVNFI